MDKEQQLKELREKLTKLTLDMDSAITKLDELEANFKRDKIEVGKVYKYSDSEIHIFMCTGIHESGNPFGYGFDSNGFVRETTYSTYNIIEATKEELEQALTKYADKLYEGVEKVDRTGLDVGKFKCIGKLDPNMQDSDGFDKDGWLSYKGRYVMDKHGVWAKPVKSKKEEVKEDYDVRITNDVFLRKADLQYPDGKYKLVRVN